MLVSWRRQQAQLAGMTCIGSEAVASNALLQYIMSVAERVATLSDVKRVIPHLQPRFASSLFQVLSTYKKEHDIYPADTSPLADATNSSLQW